jgi:hypothetical protein
MVNIETQEPAAPAVAAEDLSQPNIVVPPGATEVKDLQPGELPVVTAPARRRGAQSTEPDVQVTGSMGGPPVFSKTLILEKLDFKAFQKALGRHKASGDMKKLDCLGYFNTRFAEIAYFEVTEAGTLAGRLGFGNQQLVMRIVEQTLTGEMFPAIFEVISQGESFAGPVEGLRAEDQAGFGTIGFTQLAFVGAFPLAYKGSVSGLWLCGAPVASELPAKELTALKKLLSTLSL